MPATGLRGEDEDTLFFCHIFVIYPSSAVLSIQFAEYMREKTLLVANTPYVSFYSERDIARSQHLSYHENEIRGFRATVC